MAELAGSNTVATVRLTGADGRPYRSLGWNGEPRSEFRMRSGRLSLETLPPGSWTVSITAADGRSWNGTSSTTPDRTAELRLE